MWSGWSLLGSRSCENDARSMYVEKSLMSTDDGCRPLAWEDAPCVEAMIFTSTLFFPCESRNDVALTGVSGKEHVLDDDAEHSCEKGGLAETCRGEVVAKLLLVEGGSGPWNCVPGERLLMSWSTRTAWL